MPFSWMTILMYYFAFIYPFINLILMAFFLALIVLGISHLVRCIKRRAEHRRIELAEKKNFERQQYIENNDSIIKQLKLLNVRYCGQFDNSLRDEYCYFQEFQTKSKFDTFNPEKYLEGLIVCTPSFYEGILKGVLKNKVLSNSYLHECCQLMLSRDVPDGYDGLFDSEEQYLKVRDSLFSQWKLAPRIEAKVTVTWSYQSPAGRNTYRGSRSFDSKALTNLCHRAEERARAEKERYDAASYQRSQMTPKLRFEVMKRDGYRCRICGRSASEGAKLEVDHIIPVSKGGKTIMSNLQTLCRECNRGKAARSM